MTSVDLDAARKAAREAQERADKATPGPWRVGGAYHPREETKVAEGGGWILAPGSEQLVRSTGFDFDAYRARCPGNVAFIAAARSDVPDLAALVLAMAEEVERLRVAGSRREQSNEVIRGDLGPPSDRRGG